MSENGELDEQRHMHDGSDSGSEWEDEDEDDGLPSYEFRFECAKMLLELEDTVDTAIQVGLRPHTAAVCTPAPLYWLLMLTCHVQTCGDLELQLYRQQAILQCCPGTPGIPTRCAVCCLIAQLTLALACCAQVLEDLLAENDSVLDVWHLLGLSYYSGGMLEEAAEVCKTGMQLMKQEQVGPEEGIAMAFDDLHSAISEAQAAAKS